MPRFVKSRVDGWNTVISLLFRDAGISRPGEGLRCSGHGLSIPRIVYVFCFESCMFVSYCPLRGYCFQVGTGLLFSRVGCGVVGGNDAAVFLL